MTRHLQSREGTRWAARAALRLLQQRFREGRDRMGPARWRGFWRAAGVGLVALFGLMVLLRVATGFALDAGWLASERAVIEALGGADGLLGLSDAVFVQTFGSDMTLLLVLAATVSGALLARRPAAAAAIALAAIGTDLVVRFGWLIWDRARPDLLYDGVASPGFHSFPSGHAAKSMAVYGVLAILWALASRSAGERLLAAVLAVTIATLTGAGRIAMGVHWPSDVAGGLLLGMVWALWLGWALRRAETAP